MIIPQKIKEMVNIIISIHIFFLIGVWLILSFLKRVRRGFKKGKHQDIIVVKFYTS